MSMLSRRSQTPTVSSFHFLRAGQSSMRSSDEAKRPQSPPAVAPGCEPLEGLDNHGLKYTPSDSLSYYALDDLERRHELLLKDIASVEIRLGQVATRVKD